MRRYVGTRLYGIHTSYTVPKYIIWYRYGTYRREVRVKGRDGQSIHGLSTTFDRWSVWYEWIIARALLRLRDELIQSPD